MALPIHTATLNPIDVHIGARIATARGAAGLSIEQLAWRTGLRPAQVPLMETGSLRATPQMLFALSKSLGLPISYFYEN